MTTMLDGAPDSLSGRCPMCSQRVILTVEIRDRRVECPRCHHRESGSVFIDTETPVAVLLADGGRPDPQTIALPRSDAPAGAYSEHGVPEDERTHLLLEAESVLDDEPRPARPAAARVPAPKRKPPDDERTHLLLDPVDLKDEPEPAVQRRATTAAGGRWLGAGLVLDEVMHGRWRLALAIVAVACGVAPPILDGIGAEEGAGVSQVASFVTFLALGAYGLAWVSRSRADRGVDAGLIMARLRASFERWRRDISELRHSPSYLRLLLAGQVLALVGLLGIFLASGVCLLRALFDSYDPPSLLRLACGVLGVGGAALSYAGERAAPAAAPGPDDFTESVAAANQLPPIVDLDEPLPASFIGGYTTFHKALGVMSQWRGDAGPDEGSCRAALERHLQRHLSGSRIESERWLGPRRRDGVAQLLVDGMILIEVRRGFTGADADQALTQLRGLARRWVDKPMILCVFEAPRAALFESAATASLLQLHEAAPFVAARMPTRR